MDEIRIGQKLYHFAYGPMTVIKVGKDTVTTVADYPKGFRQKMDYNIGVYSSAPNARSVKGKTEEELLKDSGFEGYRAHAMANEQTWMTIVIGHWVFDNPDDVGKENNDFNFKSIYPNAGPEGPYDPAIGPANEIDYYHQWYFDNGYLNLNGKMKNGRVLVSPTGHDSRNKKSDAGSSGLAPKEGSGEGSSGLAPKTKGANASSGLVPKEGSGEGSSGLAPRAMDENTSSGLAPKK